MGRLISATNRWAARQSPMQMRIAKATGSGRGDINNIDRRTGYYIRDSRRSEIRAAFAAAK